MLAKINLSRTYSMCVSVVVLHQYKMFFSEWWLQQNTVFTKRNSCSTQFFPFVINETSKVERWWSSAQQVKLVEDISAISLPKHNIFLVTCTTDSKLKKKKKKSFCEFSASAKLWSGCPAKLSSGCVWWVQNSVKSSLYLWSFTFFKWIWKSFSN